MKILNNQNKIIGVVEHRQDEKGKYIPFAYRYTGKGLNKINDSFPIRANDEAAACYWVCKYFGKGTSYLLFTV